MHEALEDVRDRVAFQHAHQQPMRCVAAVVGQEARRDVAATDVAVDHDGEQRQGRGRSGQGGANPKQRAVRPQQSGRAAAFLVGQTPQA